MPAIVPYHFLVRLAHPCPYVAKMPLARAEHVVDLPAAARVDNHAGLAEQDNYADVRLAWNELGLGVQVTVTGKEQEPQGDIARPRTSDGLTLWIDTRGDRTSHRASRTCHQFHLLANGGDTLDGAPAFVQTKINRAIQDAPLCHAGDILFRGKMLKTGYRLEAFLPADELNGYDPEQYPQLGMYYAVRDQELGDQYLSVNSDFPFADDPSLWATLNLVK